MNTRLANILRNNKCSGGQFLDDYNQKVYDDIVPTITTKIITSCHYFIYEEDKQIRSEPFEGQEGKDSKERVKDYTMCIHASVGGGRENMLVLVAEVYEDDGVQDVAISKRSE